MFTEIPVRIANSLKALSFYSKNDFRLTYE